MGGRGSAEGWSAPGGSSMRFSPSLRRGTGCLPFSLNAPCSYKRVNNASNLQQALRFTMARSPCPFFAHLHIGMDDSKTEKPGIWSVRVRPLATASSPCYSTAPIPPILFRRRVAPLSADSHRYLVFLLPSGDAREQRIADTGKRASRCFGDTIYVWGVG